MEQKLNRPYVLVLINVYGIDFAIPLRSHINHPHVVWTDKENKCGLDLSKSVVITNKNIYIDTLNQPAIRQNEFDSLKGKERYVIMRMHSYIEKYKKALSNQTIYRNQLLCSYSTLKYFHEYIGLE